MKREYTAEELLPLSGIQHFCFCRRQWALIHVERQWQENLLTTEGKLMHVRADDPSQSEIRAGVFSARAMPVSSYRLGFYGICDVVEFIPDGAGVALPGRSGLFLPVPVEYKHGKEKLDHSDEAHVCAQAICLEEMLSVKIPFGLLFYGKTRHREEVTLNDELRNFVVAMAQEMHAYYERGHTPKVKISSACKSCSLEQICLPTLQQPGVSASQYIKEKVDGD